MRAFWQAVAMLAQNKDSFADRVRDCSEIEIRNELPKEPVDLQEQPTFQALERLNDLFRGLKPPLYMSAYELAEINRAVLNPATMDVLHRFWETVTKDASNALKGALNEPRAEFLQTIGALAIDSYLSFRAWYEHETGARQANGKTILENHGFELLPHEKELLGNLEPGSKAQTLLDLHVASSWGGSGCTSRATAFPGWVHTNE
jgi:hypothetical protein